LQPWVLSYRIGSTQAEEGQNGHDHYNQPDQINDPVHVSLLVIVSASPLTDKRGKSGNCSARVSDLPGSWRDPHEEDGAADEQAKKDNEVSSIIAHSAASAD
jgi:hypothetical protein